MVLLIASNKGGDANSPEEYGGISCWLEISQLIYSFLRFLRKNPFDRHVMWCVT